MGASGRSTKRDKRTRDNLLQLWAGSQGRADAQPRRVGDPLSQMQVDTRHGNPLGLQVWASLEHLFDPWALPGVPISVDHHWVPPVRRRLTPLRVVRTELTNISIALLPALPADKSTLRLDANRAEFWAPNPDRTRKSGVLRHGSRYDLNSDDSSLTQRKPHEKVHYHRCARCREDGDHPSVRTRWVQCRRRGGYGRHRSRACARNG